MAAEFKGTINVDIRDSEPDWDPFQPAKAPEGAPNVVYIVLDDVGFSGMSSYGGPIDTPNIDRVAADGLRYTQWHTTALCSPTRSCLLTGRNHTRNSMACITEAAIGFPNASGTIPPENGMLSEILGDLGWNTYMVGKWHLCPDAEMNVASTRRNWPSGRGFDRVQSIVAGQGADSAEADFLDILPAACAADRARRPFVVGWLCRAAGAPLEFITNAALPEPERGNGRALPGPESASGRALLFPPGAGGCGGQLDHRVRGPGLGAVPWAPGAASAEPAGARAPSRKPGSRAGSSPRLPRPETGLSAGSWWPSPPACSVPRRPGCAPR